MSASCQSYVTAVTAFMRKEAVVGARTLKDRYTLLSLLRDAGLLDEYADAYVAERAP